MSGGLVILEDETKLRKLGDIVFYKEKNRTLEINFQSTHDQVTYLHNCNSSYQTVIAILDDASPFKDKFAGDQTKSPIADDIYGYSIYSINTALQTVRNFTLRKDYLESIKDHIHALMKAVEDLPPTNSSSDDAAAAQRIAKEAAEYKDTMKRFLTNYNSSKSAAFSEALKAQGVTFDGLINKYKGQLHFPGRFQDLNDAQKIQVYNKIIEASGIGGIISTEAGGVFMLADAGAAGGSSSDSGAKGSRVILRTLGKMVWDIFTDDRPIHSATKDAVNALAEVAGAALKEVVKAAVATMMEEVEMSEIFVTVAGMAASFGGTFIITTAAMVLIDLIFFSGGTAPLLTDGIYCYVPELPDGAVIARQINHGGSLLELETPHEPKREPALPST